MGRRIVNGSRPHAGPRHGASRQRGSGRTGRPGSAASLLRSVWHRPRRRLAAGGLLGIGALLAAILIPAAANAAGPGNITLLSAGPNAADSPLNPADLAIELNDLNSQFVTSVTMTLTDPTTGAHTVLGPQLWQYPTTGSTSDQLVTLLNPLAQADLPLGTYNISVDASDATETDTGLTTSAPPLVYMYSGVVLTASSTQISFGNVNATVSGTLMGVPPWGTDKTSVGIGNEPVTLINGTTGTSAQIGTTGQDGSYSSAPVAEDPDDTYSVTVSADSGINTQTVSLPLNVHQIATMVSAAVTPVDLVYNKSTGMMQGQASVATSGGKFVPLAGSSVTVDVGTAAKVVKSTLVATKSNGTFSFSLPSTEGTHWSVHAGGTALLLPSTATGTVHVAVPVSFASSSMQLDPFGRVSASACLRVTAANFTPPTSPAPQLQTAQRRDGPWHTLATMALQPRAGSCAATNESLFTVVKSAKYFPGAYYRELFPSGINFQRALTAVVHQSKTQTALLNSAESPKTVKAGGKITFTGQLMQRVGRSFKPFGNQQFEIGFQLPHNGALDCLSIDPKSGPCRMFKTKANGKFTATFADLKGSTNWVIEYNGGSKHYAVRSQDFFVTVKGGGKARAGGPPGTPLPGPPVFRTPFGPA